MFLAYSTIARTRVSVTSHHPPHEYARHRQKEKHPSWLDNLAHSKEHVVAEKVCHDVGRKKMDTIASESDAHSY
jgi:hypothetical protein